MPDGKLIITAQRQSQSTLIYLYVVRSGCSCFMISGLTVVYDAVIRHKKAVVSVFGYGEFGGWLQPFWRWPSPALVFENEVRC